MSKNKYDLNNTPEHEVQRCTVPLFLRDALQPTTGEPIWQHEDRPRPKPVDVGSHFLNKYRDKGGW